MYQPYWWVCKPFVVERWLCRSVIRMCAVVYGEAISNSCKNENVAKRHCSSQYSTEAVYQQMLGTVYIYV